MRFIEWAEPEPILDGGRRVQVEGPHPPAQMQDASGAFSSQSSAFSSPTHPNAGSSNRDRFRNRKQRQRPCPRQQPSPPRSRTRSRPQMPSRGDGVKPHPYNKKRRGGFTPPPQTLLFTWILEEAELIAPVSVSVAPVVAVPPNASDLNSD